MERIKSISRWRIYIIEENEPKNPDESPVNTTVQQTDLASDETLNDQSEGSDASLSNYSNEQIESARIWSQLGPNQEIDTL